MYVRTCAYVHVLVSNVRPEISCIQLAAQCMRLLEDGCN